jgi:hypothetical protein
MDMEYGIWKVLYGLRYSIQLWIGSLDGTPGFDIVKVQPSFRRLYSGYPSSLTTVLAVKGFVRFFEQREGA